MSEFSLFVDTNQKPIYKGHCENLSSSVPTVCVGQLLCVSGGHGEPQCCPSPPGALSEAQGRCYIKEKGAVLASAAWK